MAATSGWVGVDLDGTLAQYDEWRGEEHIGPPVPEMVRRVKQMLVLGIEVRIFTARVYCGESDDPHPSFAARALIEQWCLTHLGQILPVTCTKDFGMIELWDDRVVCVERNTGKVLGRNNP